MNRDLWSYLAETFWLLVTAFLFLALILGIAVLSVAIAWVLGFCRRRREEPIKPSWPDRLFTKPATDSPTDDVTP